MGSTQEVGSVKAGWSSGKRTVREEFPQGCVEHFAQPRHILSTLEMSGGTGGAPARRDLRQTQSFCVCLPSHAEDR